MRKVLLYHVFPVNDWREVTENLLSGVPHEDIFVHASFVNDPNTSESQIMFFFKSFRNVRAVFFSNNSQHPEVDAMELFRNRIDLSAYSILTYMHSKGVTKPNNQNIKDWTELMRYFLIDKMTLCIRAFKRGYLIYGVNKTQVSKADKDFHGANFFYAGNFVSVNLTSEIVEKIRTVSLFKEYYGLEGFWGKLCSNHLAYNAFHSRINHYLSPFPAAYYKSWIGRWRYSIVSYCYHYYYSFNRKNNS